MSHKNETFVECKLDFVSESITVHWLTFYIVQADSQDSHRFITMKLDAAEAIRMKM